MGQFEGTEFDLNVDSIFAGSPALGEVSKMKVEMEEDGLVKTRACEICSRQQSCLMTWSELFALREAILPQQVGQIMRRPDLFPTPWLYNRKFQCFHPQHRCRCDPRAVLIFDITPSEAARHFDLAAQNGQISPTQQGIIGAMQPAIAHIKSQRIPRR